MKYVILSDSDNVEPFIEPRQLSKVNGETLIGRTIRLLKQNGIKDAIITSHDPRFDNLGAERYEPKNNTYKPKENKGYWLDAFPKELLNEPITFLLGDIYYSEEAIKTIIEKQTDSVLFFCSYKNTDERYIKHHDEPFAFKVVDTDLFKKHIDIVKDMYDKGKTGRHPIAWELYRSINGLDINVHKMTDNYIAINDETCDVDRVEDINLLELKVGGNKMVRVEVIEGFTLGKFNELKEIVRAGQDIEGELFIGDTFLCDNDMAKYLTNETKNPGNRAFVKVIEVIPEEVTEEVVQAVANAIVEEADEQNKEIKEVVQEIVEESKEPKKKTKKSTTKKTTTKKKTTK